VRPAADPAVAAVVHAAFAHRRKALAGSLALASRDAGAAMATGVGGIRFVPDVRERAREALVALGHPADQRAERLAPEEFRELTVRVTA
jgi:16S rRNA (adenine1518-N6/adenine1519-N6)-dimethyltransferase